MLERLMDVSLPDGLPVLPGVEFGARYLLAEDDVHAGGDWFDAVPLDDGSVGMIVGDVPGTGVEASVAMAQLEALFEDIICETGLLLDAVEAMARRARHVADARATTVCAGILHPDSGVFEYCTAGHPPPLVLTREGAARFLQPSGGAALGATDDQAPRTKQHRLAPGEVVLLYTDGLIERPGRTPAAGTASLARSLPDLLRPRVGCGPAAAAAHPGTERQIDRVCRRTLEVATQAGRCRDDVTVLAAQLRAPAAPLYLVVPARRESARLMHGRIDDWLGCIGVSALDEVAIQHAIGELVANSVAHAYSAPRTGDRIEVTAHLDVTGVLHASVADSGRWREPHPHRVAERGLAMVRSLVDDLVVRHDLGGTSARFRLRLKREAPLLRAVGLTTEPATPQPVGEWSEFGLTTEGTVLLPTGVIDEEGAARLQRAIDTISRGGTRSVTVDLSGVTLLASIAVRTLVVARVGETITLVAPLGSPAQQVLDVVRLPYQSQQR